jgi:5'-nucleotidase
LTANYDFSETILKDAFKPYKIFKKGPLRIGVFGINIELKGLVSEASCGKTKYLDPIEKANEIATHLKLDKQCDFIICLSHLGYKYDNNKVSDLVLAQNTRYIDLILGGHTHTFLDVPDIVRNLEGRDVMINQVGWAGINLGKLEFYFDKKRKLKDVKAHTVIISKNTIG